MADELRRIVNYTGHELALEHGGFRFKMESHGHARVSSKMRVVDSIGNIPILEIRERRAIGIPEPRENVLYVVSGIVAAVTDRPDIVCPGRVKRENGVAVSASALIRVLGHG